MKKYLCSILLLLSVLFSLHFLRGMDNSDLHNICMLGALAIGDQETASGYIRDGANVNYVIDGIPLLHMASVNKDEGMVKFLLEHGANIDMRGVHEDTALDIAIMTGYIPIVDLLLTHGAMVNESMVIKAALGFQLSICDLLMGCDIVQDAQTPDEKNKVLLLMARKPNNPALCRALVAGANPNSQNEKLNTPLHFAATQGNLRSAKDLLAYRAATNIPNDTGNMPLHFACWKGHAELAQMLINAGAPLNAKNGNGDTPLHFAASYGCLPIVKALVGKCANVTITNDKNKDPEDIAGTLEIKQYLQSVKASYQLLGLVGAYVNFINKINGR